MPIQPTDFEQKDLRLALLSIQQSLRVLQGVPAPLLNVASIPAIDTPDEHIRIDEALDLLESEITHIRVGLQNYRARSSNVKEAGCV